MMKQQFPMNRSGSHRPEETIRAGHGYNFTSFTEGYTPENTRNRKDLKMEDALNLRRLIAFADTMPDSTLSSGKKTVVGRRKTARVVGYAMYEMGLDRTEAVKLIHAWNNSLDWCWTPREINSFIEWIRKNHRPRRTYNYH